MDKTKCTECEYCKMTGRALGWKGRGNFFCTHPTAKDLPMEAFGNKASCFIGFGTAEYDTKLQTKTRPRWCPLKSKEDLEEDQNCTRR